MNAPSRRLVARRSMLTRRTVLTALPALAVAACSLGKSSKLPDPAAERLAAIARRDEALRAAARTEEATLIAAYGEAGRMHPSLQPVLNVIAAHHTAHAHGMGAAAMPVAPSGTVSPTGTASQSGTASPSSAVTPTATILPAVPDTAAGRRATITTLAGLEKRAEAARHAACLVASPSLAPTLASIAAAESAHQVLLAGVGV